MTSAPTASPQALQLPSAVRIVTPRSLPKILEHVVLQALHDRAKISIMKHGAKVSIAKNRAARLLKTVKAKVNQSRADQFLTDLELELDPLLTEKTGFDHRRPLATIQGRQRSGKLRSCLRAQRSMMTGRITKPERTTFTWIPKRFFDAYIDKKNEMPVVAVEQEDSFVKGDDFVPL